MEEIKNKVKSYNSKLLNITNKYDVAIKCAQNNLTGQEKENINNMYYEMKRIQKEISNLFSLAEEYRE